MYFRFVIIAAVKDALRKAVIPKHASVHTLRHSFATHLLQSGVNICEMLSLLGHKNVETTMIYTQVLRDISNAPHSPRDVLYKTPQSVFDLPAINCRPCFPYRKKP
jgi:integrase